MAKRVAQNAQVHHLPLQFIRFGAQFCARKIELAVPPEHRCDLNERKAGCFAQRDQRKPQQNIRVELSPKPVPAKGANEADFLVIPQGRRGYARTLSNFAYIQHFYA